MSAHPALSPHPYKAPNDRTGSEGFERPALIENVSLSPEQCRWCDALNVPHSPACPLGERYQMVQKLGGLGWAKPAPRKARGAA